MNLGMIGSDTHAFPATLSDFSRVEIAHVSHPQ